MLALPLPWPIRRRLLVTAFGYEIHATARIGLSLVAPRVKLRMAAGSSIGHGTVVKNMDDVILGEQARIGNLNWIYAIPRGHDSLAHESGRRIELILDREAVITRRHLLDCSNRIHLAEASRVVGYRSQLITHSFSMSRAPRLHTRAIAVGEHSLVGTGCILLGGASLPAYSALGAGSTLRTAFTEKYGLYSGVPAALVSHIARDSPFFT
jgi:serine acetyltransferase